jgi:colanic acid biosynthesis protein WcaH
MIDSEIFDIIVENIPILCVDGFIISDGKILLLKRNNYPAKNEWWVPGGRVLKNEALSDAIFRKVKEETNLETEIIKQIGVCETIFETKHTVNICYLLRIKKTKIILNSDHSEYKWFHLNQLPDMNIRVLEIIKKIITT